MSRTKNYKGFDQVLRSSLLEMVDLVENCQNLSVLIQLGIIKIFEI